MASLTNYKGLSVITPTPSGAGGNAINNDFKLLVDWNPKSKWDATASPSTTDDSSENYQVGSLWYNTSDQELKLCIDDTANSAEWIDVAIDVAFKSGKLDSDLTINSTTSVDTGLSFYVNTGETWRFDFYLFAKQLNSSANIRAKLNGPGSLPDLEGRWFISNITTSEVKSQDMDTLSDVISVNTSTDSQEVLHVSGIATVPSGGPIRLFLRNGTGTSVQKFHSSSYFIAQKMS